MQINVGDTVWVDEGDGAGCVEFRGVVEQINGDELTVRVNSHPVGPGAATDSLRTTDASLVFEVIPALAAEG